MDFNTIIESVGDFCPIIKEKCKHVECKFWQQIGDPVPAGQCAYIFYPLLFKDLLEIIAKKD